MYIARIENNTHSRKTDANLLTYLTPTKTSVDRINSRMLPYTLILFSIVGATVPPPVTSPNNDIFWAIFVLKEKEKGYVARKCFCTAYYMPCLTLNYMENSIQLYSEI